MSPARLVIATRESALALWQAELVRTRLLALYPSCAVELLGLTTQGDRRLDVSLADIGGKGLFIKELEQAMEQGRADLAVHSTKDVPMVMPDGFALAAILEREDPRDALVSRDYDSLASLPSGSVVGTSSQRREAQLRERFPHLVCVPVRGNVDTRVRKLDEGAYAAIILAAAGLKRLGLGERISALLDPEESLPAIGQGAICIECLATHRDVVDAVAALSHAPTALAVTAERAFGLRMGGDCRTPIAGYATKRGDVLWLRGVIARRDGSEVMRAQREARVTSVADANALGEALAADMIARGAERVLKV
ncbi:MAG: hydroxymethylbilane synthase [Betaproteobacteria bacterium]